MSDEYEGRERRQTERSAVERHAQSLLLVIVAGLIGWVGLSISSMGQMIARLEERVTYMTTQISDLKNGNYTQTDAVRDIGRVDGRIDELSGRVQRLEGER